MTNFYTLYLYKRGFADRQMGYASAMAWVLLIAVAIIAFILFRPRSPGCTTPERTDDHFEAPPQSRSSRTPLEPDTAQPRRRVKRKTWQHHHLVRRAPRADRDRALPAGVAVPVHVQAVERVRVRTRACSPRTRPSRTTRRSSRASPERRCGGSSRTRSSSRHGRDRHRALLRAGRVRVRPDPVPRRRHPVRRDDRHAAAAVPRDDHPAVHHVQ